MTIIQKNGHGLVKPGSGYHQVRSVIAIDIARHNLQPSSRRDDQNGLASRRTELQLNPIIRSEDAARASSDRHQVRTKIPVKISDGKRQADSRLRYGSFTNIRRRKSTSRQEEKGQPAQPGKVYCPEAGAGRLHKPKIGAAMIHVLLQIPFLTSLHYHSLLRGENGKPVASGCRLLR
jgi:hypothetical protein